MHSGHPDYGYGYRNRAGFLSEVSLCKLRDATKTVPLKTLRATIVTHVRPTVRSQEIVIGHQSPRQPYFSDVSCGSLAD